MKAYYNQEKIASSLRKFFKKVLNLSKPHLYLISYIITALTSGHFFKKEFLDILLV